MTYHPQHQGHNAATALHMHPSFWTATNPAVLNPDVWKKEYGGSKILPSSFREEPSHALKRAEQIIGPFIGLDILDVGCGGGRNALALAVRNHVHAIDFCPQALSILERKVLLSRPPVLLSYHIWNALKPNEEFRGRFDIMLDAYFSCHIVDETILEIWHSNAHSYLRPGGFLLIFGFTDADGYYAQFEINRSGALVISKDIFTGIDKRLDSAGSIRDLYPDFCVVHSEHVRFDDFVLGKIYNRDILLSILRRTPKIV